jgi:HlyD family secretion protein
MPFIKGKFFGVLQFLRRHWKLISLVTLLTIGAGYFFYSKQQQAKPKLNFTKPEVRDLTKTLEVSGLVDAKEKASLRFAAGGKIVYLGAKEGDYVKKSQTIATIDRATLQKQLQQDLNAYTRERIDWENRQDGSDYNVESLTTRRSIDQEQTTLNDTVLDVEIQDIAIRNTVLSAPFGGILVSSPTTVTGINLLATDVFEVVNPDTLIFKAAVDEADVANVSLGQSAKVTLDAYPDQPFEGNVAFISYKSQQSSSGTVFVVEIPISGTDLLNRYRLGMNGDAEITLATKTHVMTIPLDATRQRDDKTYVDVKTSDTTTEEREIQVGLETDDLIEVTSGLKIDEEIVIPE